MRKWHKLISLLLFFALLIAACAPKATEAPAVIATTAPPTEAPAKPTTAPATEAPTAAPVEKPVKITIWSHWVDEPVAQKYLQEVWADYETEHPNVDITVEFSQKADFLAAAINAFTVGEGGPDLFFVDREIQSTFTIVDAGWAAPLDNVIDWTQMVPASKDAASWKNAKGETHTWYGMIEAYADMILYNPKIFEELGIVLPENYQLTADEFYNMAVQCRKAGYDPIGAGSGDRKYPGQYIYKFALISKLGMEEFTKLWNGKISWDDPRVRETLEWVQKLVEIPAFPATYSTMLLAESFQYFHTKQKACMFTVGTWYTGRTFKSPEEGGQPVDFRNGFMRYPAFPDGVGTNQGNMTAGAGFAVWQQGPNREIAEDIVRFMLQEKYGTKWIVDTGGLPGIKYNPDAISEDNPFKWYFDGFNKSYGTYDWAMNLSNPCPDLYSAYEAYINDGLAPQLITIDEAIAGIEAARAKCGG